MAVYYMQASTPLNIYINTTTFLKLFDLILTSFIYFTNLQPIFSPIFSTEFFPIYKIPPPPHPLRVAHLLLCSGVSHVEILYESFRA